MIKIMKLDELVQTDAVKNVREAVKDFSTMPNLLFYGLPGTGKTTTAYAIANHLKVPIKEFNASDDRGIDFIRTRVKEISRAVTKKIILLDEADGITPDAQQALRRLMEKTNSKFILTANNIAKIIPPLQSRCLKIEFTPPSFEELKELAVKFGHSEEMATKLARKANGDFRFIINANAGIVETETSFERVWNSLCAGRFPQVDGLDYSSIFQYLADKILDLEEYNGKKLRGRDKAKLIITLADGEFAYYQTQSKLQVQATFLKILKIFSDLKNENRN